MSDLIKKITNKNYDDAKSLFEERITNVVEKKMLENKKIVGAKLEQLTMTRKAFDGNKGARAEKLYRDIVEENPPRPPAKIPYTTVKSAQGPKVEVDINLGKPFQAVLDYADQAGLKIDTLSGRRPGSTIKDPSTGADTGKPSTHATGKSMDINPEDNPHVSNRQWSKVQKTSLPRNLIDIAKAQGLKWGGEWKSSKDPMHFGSSKSEGGIYNSNGTVNKSALEKSKSIENKTAMKAAEYTGVDPTTQNFNLKGTAMAKAQGKTGAELPLEIGRNMTKGEIETRAKEARGLASPQPYNPRSKSSNIKTVMATGKDLSKGKLPEQPPRPPAEIPNVKPSVKPNIPKVKAEAPPKPKESDTRKRFKVAYAAAKADPNIGMGGTFDFEGGKYKVYEDVNLHEARIAIIKARIRGGKVQRRKKVSNVPGYTLRGGGLKRMSAMERRNRKMGQKRGKIKRRMKLARTLVKRQRSLRKRQSLGLK